MRTKSLLGQKRYCLLFFLFSIEDNYTFAPTTILLPPKIFASLSLLNASQSAKSSPYPGRHHHCRDCYSPRPILTLPIIGTFNPLSNPFPPSILSPFSGSPSPPSPPLSPPLQTSPLASILILLPPLTSICP